MDTIAGDDAMQNPPHPPLAGLDPAALLKQGVAADTVPEDAPPFHLPPIGELEDLFPQFEILEFIGQGGMGAVYKVRQKELDRVVALKILPPAIGGTPGFSERFAREAKALARLNHPGIVTIHEFGKTSGPEQPLYFILMEFVDGVNLAQLMKAGRISPREALAIVPQICDALQSAHDQGIVHRDIKPENILLDRLGRVKVADFGIAKVVGNVSSGDDGAFGGGPGEQWFHADATLGEKVIGTPQYMAPEQMGSPAEVDHRADIYALGVVFYQMLTGELPGKDLQAPSRKVRIDVRLDEMVLRALDSDPERRYQTAHEFRTMLDELPSAPSSVPPPPKRGMIRRWWWMFLVMIVIGPVIGLGAGSIFARFIPKKYESEAVVELKPRDGQTMSPSRFGTEFEKIKSTTSLTEVAKQLGLLKKLGLRGEREAVSILKGIVRTENVRGTNLITIQVRHTDNEDAANIARAVARNYKRNSNDEVVVHEEPTVSKSPVSPNIPLLLVMWGAGGLLFSPLMALLLIPLFQWMFPERRKDGTSGGGLPVWIIVPLLLLVTGIGLVVGGAALGYVTLGNVTTSSPPGVTGGMTYEDEEREKVAEAHANQYLDLVLEMAAAEAVGLGESHPERIVTNRKLDRFNAAYPDMPDMPDARCIELAGRRLRDLEERMMEVKDRGLGEKHPSYVGLKVRADSLKQVIAGKDGVPEGKAPADPRSVQERIVDLEISAIKLRKMFLPDHPDVKKAALAVDDFIRANPTARGGDYVEVLKRRREEMRTRIEEASRKYLGNHPRMAELKNEQEAIEQLLGIARHVMIRPPRPSATGEVRYRFDSAGDTMQMMVHRIRREHGLRICHEVGERKDDGQEGIRYSDLQAELEMKEIAGRMTPRESERLVELRMHQMPETTVTDETRYYGELAAVSERDLLEQLTEGTPYQCRSGADGKRWVVSPREGSRLDYPVTLDTRGLTVEQAAGLIAAQSAGGKVRLIDRGPHEARPWRDVVCEPRKFENRPAWEVLCEIGAQAHADSVYDLTSVLVIQPGQWGGVVKPSDAPTRLHILADGSAKLDGVAVSPNELEAALKALRGKSKDAKVALSADARVAYAAVKEIMGLCQNTGLWNLTFVKEDKDGVLEWLAKMDAGRYAECYADSADFVKKAVSAEKWKETMDLFRTSLGTAVSRRMLRSEDVKQLPGAPDGEYRVMLFQTDFANKKSAVETVTFTKENDGVWRCSGYLIR